jgi:hypothetical protein
MDKQTFIVNAVENARGRCIGSRARAMFSAEQTAEKAAAEWDRLNSPEAIERQAQIERLTALGGKPWTGEHEVRVYFNAIPVGNVGRTFDFYVSMTDGSIHGCLTDEERAAADAILN